MCRTNRAVALGVRSDTAEARGPFSERRPARRRVVFARGGRAAVYGQEELACASG